MISTRRIIRLPRINLLRVRSKNAVLNRWLNTSKNQTPLSQFHPDPNTLIVTNEELHKSLGDSSEINTRLESMHFTLLGEFMKAIHNKNLLLYLLKDDENTIHEKIFSLSFSLQKDLVLCFKDIICEKSPKLVPVFENLENLGKFDDHKQLKNNLIRELPKTLQLLNKDEILEIFKNRGLWFTDSRYNVKKSKLDVVQNLQSFEKKFDRKDLDKVLETYQSKLDETDGSSGTLSLFNIKINLLEDICYNIMHRKINETDLLKLITFFNHNKLYNYSYIVSGVVEIASKTYKSNELIDELLNLHIETNNPNFFLYIYHSIIINEVRDDKFINVSTMFDTKKLFNKYNINFINGELTDEDPNYKFSTIFKASHLLPPIKEPIIKMIHDNKQIWKQEVNEIFTYNNDLSNKKGKFVEVCELKDDSSTGNKIHTPLTDMAKIPLELDTISFNTILIALEGCFKFGFYSLMDILIYKFMLNSYVISDNLDGNFQLKMRVQRFPDVPKEYLAGNNLLMNRVNYKDIKVFFPMELLDVYIRKIYATNDSKQLKWLLHIVKTVYLTPLVVTNILYVNELYCQDKEKFLRIYDNFYGLDDVIKYVMYQSLINPQPGEITEDILDSLYNTCVKLGKFQELQIIEEDYKIDFDRIIKDKKFRKATRPLIFAKKLKQSNFNAFTQSWCEEERILGLSGLFFN